jgi:hypothetical protein
MLRLLTGFLKGAVIGACVGAVSWRIGFSTGLPGFVDYGIVGGLVGLLVGRPPWRHETFWTPMLKTIFGCAVGIGLYFAAHKLLGGARLDFTVALGAPDKPLVDVPIVLGPIIGGLWGMLVELDDSSSADDTGKPITRR